MFKFGKNYNPKLDELVGLLPQKGNVLDLGCGMGGNSVFLAEKGFNVTCVDKDREVISEIRDNYPDINAINSEILDFQFPENEYDLVIILNVLHFFKLEDIKKIIENILKSLKNNGLLYLQVFSKKDPNKKFLHLFDKKELSNFFSKHKILELEQFTKKENHPPTGEHEHEVIRMLIRK